MKTKFLFSVLLALIGLSLCAQTKTDTLTNEKIIQLSKIGLQPSVIINKIQTSVTRFDVGTDDLINLNNNQVASDVINEMMKVATEQQVAVAYQKDMNDPATMHSPGIYYYYPNDKNKPIRKVDPTVASSGHSGGGSFYGFGGSKETSIISGGKSKMQINETMPVFYFYFEHNTNPFADNWWFATATSPNEFVLVKLDETKSSRVFQIGSTTTIGGFGGGNSGIPEKVKVPFTYEQVSDGIYKVVFQQALKPGEYCFVYASSTPNRYSNDKVFDFGIPKLN